MRRRTLIAAGVLGVALVAFFFAPVVPMDIVPCVVHGTGYASPSYRLFYVGEIYLGGYFGHFEWATFNGQNCI